MQLSAHLTFGGQCEQAFNFYRALIGGELFVVRYGDSPMARQVEPQWHSKVLHATLTVGNNVLTGTDVPAGQRQHAQGIFVLLSVDSGEVERIFEALAEGGHVAMPLQRTFWSKAFGALVDQFGIPWEISAASSS